ncbi:MAG: lipopolysaccharide biosynthesis protein [Brevefilum sp.]|nr:lipopolysaccharide biosynthesis protein [Brevefilum sp.]
MSELKQKTINGMVWSVSERISLQVMHMLISIILARLLSPSEFGLLGMLAIFTSIAQSVLDSGFGSALIQKKDATQTDSSSIFYFNLLIGIFLASIFFFSAPLIADFYQQPILKPITRVLSLNMIINAFSLVQLSILRKKMEFKNHFIVSLIAVLFSGVTGILAAYNGLGVWSLVIQTLSHSLAQASALWILSKWRPIGHFSFKSLKTMFSFGSRLLVAGIIETVFKNLYQTFIGKVYSPSDVGYYSRASTMGSAASVATSMALGTVVFSAFSPYQDDDITLRKVHSKTIKMSMFVLMPVMIGLIAIAEPLFLFLLTEKWAESIPYFQLLSVIGLLFPIVVQNYNLLRIKGRTDLHLRLEIFKYIITVIAIALTYKHGIIALIYGQIAVAVISHFVVSYFVGRLVDYTLIDQLKALFPQGVISLIMGGSIYFVGNLLNTDSNLLIFSTQIVLGVIIYFLLNKLIKSPELEEFLSIIGNFTKTLLSKLKGKR